MSNMNILVVDDNPEVADSFADAFTEMGHRVEVIGNKGRCLETVPKQFTPDALLLDASMPSVFLLKVLARYHTPAVGISGGKDSNLPGRIPMIEKPSEPSLILAALESAKSDSDARRVGKPHEPC